MERLEPALRRYQDARVWRFGFRQAFNRLTVWAKLWRRKHFVESTVFDFFSFLGGLLWHPILSISYITYRNLLQDG